MADRRELNEQEPKSVGMIYLLAALGTLLSMIAVWLMSVFPWAVYIGPIALLFTTSGLIWSFYEGHSD